jgi:hypothetical protein
MKQRNEVGARGEKDSGLGMGESVGWCDKKVVARLGFASAKPLLPSLGI